MGDTTTNNLEDPEEEEEELPNVIELAADADLPGLFSIRPEFISLTVFRCGNETWGCDWGCDFVEEDEVVRISRVHEKGLLAVSNIAACAAPEIPPMVLQEGDTLVSINDDVITKRDELDPLRGILTLVFHTSSPSNMYQSLVLQPEGHGIECRRNRRRRFLQISALSDAWKHSVVKVGHLVLAIGLAPSLQLDPRDAEILLDSPGRDVLCITTAPDPSSFSWRKAVVGVGGGAMVGVGGVLMVTPLHPVGHGLALGGMGVLGTEFEGPRKLMNAATDKLRRRDSSKSSTSEKSTPEEKESPEKAPTEKAAPGKSRVEKAAPEKALVEEATVA